MKGTLFSADFVEDSTGNLKLLELNTDTAFTSGALSHVDFNPFISILSSSNITEVEVIYKEAFQSNFITELSESISQSLPSVAFSKYIESYDSIYPIQLVDSDDKFILRCVYDESAIFDSTYCKEKNKVIELFYENNDTNSIPEFYLSSSIYVDTLGRRVNTSVAPDVAVKNLEDVHAPLNFFKVEGTGSIEENYSSFLNKFPSSSLIVNYYENPAEGTHTALRSFNIIYGNNLDIVNLADIRAKAILDKPTSLSFITSSVPSPVSTKHYYELTTNFPTLNFEGGLFEEEEIVDVNGNPIKVSEANVGQTFKSTYIEGTPNTDLLEIFTQWSYPGSTLPSGSYPTSSILVNNIPVKLKNNLVNHIITEDSSSIRINAGQHLLIYDSDRDVLRYEDVFSLDSNAHRLLGSSGSLVRIISNEIEVLEEEHNVHILDMESTDTFNLYNGELNVKLVTHNCFPAGTRISLFDGSYKNIEEISDKDTLMSFNEHSLTHVPGKAEYVKKAIHNKLIVVDLENGTQIKSTPLHRFFTERGWVHAESLTQDDLVFQIDKEFTRVVKTAVEEGDIEVYQLINVKDNHTYFVEDTLVHNQKIAPSCFIAGTQISTEDGNQVPIEKIKVGDKVLSYNEQTGKQELETVYEIVTPIHDDIVTYTYEEGTLSCTYDHPIYTQNLDLKSSDPDKTNAFYKLEKQVTGIELGDNLINLQGKETPILSIDKKIIPETQTYLLRITGNHNFYANGVLVHNK